MGANNFLLQRLKGRNNDNFNRVIALVAEENGVSESKVKFDFAKNFLKHRMGTFDYFYNDFYNLSEEEKKEVLTISTYDNILAYLNPIRYRGILEDKLVFNKVYQKYLKRQYLDLRLAGPGDIENFIRETQRDHVFAKTTGDFGGQGIDRVAKADITDPAAFQQQCIDNKQYLLEEELVQHDVMNQINPSAVNSIRVFSIRKQRQVKILGAVLRITMNNEAVVDLNYILSSVDEDGHFNPVFVDKYGQTYTEHLQTGIEFADIPPIPYMAEGQQMIKEAALELPGNRLIGWDLVILEDGPALIEGNAYGDYALVQNRLLGDQHTKMLDKIRTFLGDEFKNIDFD